jgi:hypothetical protein
VSFSVAGRVSPTIAKLRVASVPPVIPVTPPPVPPPDEDELELDVLLELDEELLELDVLPDDELLDDDPLLDDEPLPPEHDTPQTDPTSPTQVASHLVLQQYESCAQTWVTHGSHVDLSLAPAVQMACAHALVAPGSSQPAGGAWHAQLSALHHQPSKQPLAWQVWPSAWQSTQQDVEEGGARLPQDAPPGLPPPPPPPPWRRDPCEAGLSPQTLVTGTHSFTWLPSASVTAVQARSGEQPWCAQSGAHHVSPPNWPHRDPEAQS